MIKLTRLTDQSDCSCWKSAEGEHPEVYKHIMQRTAPPAQAATLRCSHRADCVCVHVQSVGEY